MISSRTRVKICGLTAFDDAELAVSLGADALGFVFWPKSPRAVRADDVAAIVRRLPPFVVRVGVFVDASPAEVGAVAQVAGLDVAQLHGHERPEEYVGAGVRVMHATSVRSDAEVDAATAWPAEVVPIVDAHDPERRGGTGTPADWTRAAALAERRPIILAGGLSAANVREAIVTVRPWAVDVSSGVEAGPGRKSPERLRAFFAAVAAVNTEDR